MFIFAPGSDEYLHATTIIPSRQNALIALQSLALEASLGIGRFLSIDEHPQTAPRGKEYIPGESEAEPQASATPSVRCFLQPTVTKIARHHKASFVFRGLNCGLDSALRLLTGAVDVSANSHNLAS